MRSSWPPTAKNRESGDQANWASASDSEQPGRPDEEESRGDRE
jgi:hypothetical protein